MTAARRLPWFSTPQACRMPDRAQQAAEPACHGALYPLQGVTGDENY
jgi:hypothetical protein